MFRIFPERKGIVLAHLKETLDYYVRLRVAEIEGDMLTVLVGKKSEKLMQKYRLWVAANADLVNREKRAGSEVTRRASRDWNLTQHPAILYEI